VHQTRPLSFFLFLIVSSRLIWAGIRVVAVLFERRLRWVDYFAGSRHSVGFFSNQSRISRNRLLRTCWKRQEHLLKSVRPNHIVAVCFSQQVAVGQNYIGQVAGFDDYRRRRLHLARRRSGSKVIFRAGSHTEGKRNGHGRSHHVQLTSARMMRSASRIAGPAACLPWCTAKVSERIAQ
jgi:hypothetical protein